MQRTTDATGKFDREDATGSIMILLDSYRVDRVAFSEVIVALG